MQQLNRHLLLAALVASLLGSPLYAQAQCWTDKHGRTHCDQGKHNGWYNRNLGSGSGLDWKTQKIIKGSLLGAGVGAGAGLLLDKPVAKTAILGAGIGAGTQATRYSNYMNRHPIVKTATYGALAGAGASQLSREGSIGKGALWGAAIGTGVGVIRDSD